MSVFSSEEQLYACLRDLFGRLEAERPQATTALFKSRLHFCLRLTGPAALVVIDARQRPLRISYGQMDSQPDLDVAVTADALHRILRGELSLTKAMGSQALKPKGPVWKVMALADLFTQAQKIYPAVLRQHGLGF